MRWKKYKLTTTTEAVDFVSELLNELGINGIEIEDNVPLSDADTKGMFIDILPKLPPDEGVAKVSFYIEDDESGKAGSIINNSDISKYEEILGKIREGLREIAAYIDVGDCTIEESETEDVDWINNWKEFFHPFTVDDILIKPTWEEVPEQDKDKLLIQIDPGTAFGTGMHETTQLCIRAIKKYLKSGNKILDVGTGSGILAITALKLGGKMAVGTDLDENAIIASRENMEVNGIKSEDFSVYTGNLIDDKNIKDAVGYEEYDIIVANILADVIIPLQSEIAPHLKKNGIFITSGIINTKEKEVKKAFEENPDLEIIEINYQGEWVSIVAKKIN